MENTSQVKGINSFIVSIGKRQMTSSAQCHFGIVFLLLLSIHSSSATLSGAQNKNF